MYMIARGMVRKESEHFLDVVMRKQGFVGAVKRL